MKKQLVIEGMSCGHCSSKVKNMLETLDGVSEVTVDLRSKTATLTALNDVSDETFRSVISEVGYEVVEVK